MSQQATAARRFGALPVYRDKGNAAGKAYKVDAIPTTVIVDKTGRLVAYFVGLQEPETIRAALKKAGLP